MPDPSTTRPAGTGVSRPELIIAAAIVLVVTVMLIALKIVNPSDQQGDTAYYEQATENIATRGVPLSSLQSDILAFTTSQLPVMTAAVMANDPLAPPADRELSVLRWHAYVVLYPIAAFAKVFPTEWVLMAFDAISFTGVVLLLYLALRRKGLPIVGAVLFCGLVVSHPAWSSALFSGQFYPDRLFLVLGVLLMYLASERGVRPGVLIAAAVACAMIHERAAVTGGIFLVAYTVLFWFNLNAPERKLRIGLGIAMIAYSTIMLKLVLVNPYYSSFLPHTFAQVIAVTQAPGFADKFGLMMLVNAVLLGVAAFAPRAAAIALLLMLPNVLGTVGGAEKTGWTTHYPTYYFAALLWAAMLGFANLYRLIATSRPRRYAFYGLAVLLALLMSAIDPNAAGKVSIASANLSANFVPRFWATSRTWLTPEHLRYNPLADEIAQAVPEGSVVSSLEAMMPYLYHNRTLRFFPIDIDHADYAAVSVDRSVPGTVTYGGAVNYLGAEELKKVNVMLVDRMKRDGYDFDHARVFETIGVAIVKRRGGASSAGRQ